MQRVIWAVLAAFAIAIVIGPFIITWLKKLKFGQTINELGPQSHQKKQGTATMGGLIFAIAAPVSTIAFSHLNGDLSFLLLVLVCAFGFGLIGFVDDFIIVKLKRSLGLTPKQKTIPMVILSLGVALWAYLHPEIGSSLKVPFFNVEWDLGWFYIPVMMFVMVGTVNSANLLDGMDGLLGGCSLFDFATMALICISTALGVENATGMMNVAIFAGAMVGALMGFLRFNSHPARVFMGDVGSFFIGGALMGICIVTRLSLLLPVIALAMLISSLSVIMQTIYFKYTRKKTGTGKRIFKMSPLHHHFELSGMPETHVVAMYYLVTVVLCLLALTGFVA